MRRFLLTRPRRYVRMAQLVLVSPLILMWVGILEFYRTRRTELFESLFPNSRLMLVLLVAVPAIGLFYTLFRMYKMAPEKLAWCVDILLCIFVAMSMFVVAGQILSL